MVLFPDCLRIARCELFGLKRISNQQDVVLLLIVDFICLLSCDQSFYILLWLLSQIESILSTNIAPSVDIISSASMDPIHSPSTMGEPSKMSTEPVAGGGHMMSPDDADNPFNWPLYRRVYVSAVAVAFAFSMWVAFPGFFLDHKFLILHQHVRCYDIYSGYYGSDGRLQCIYDCCHITILTILLWHCLCACHNAASHWKTWPIRSLLDQPTALYAFPSGFRSG